MDIPYKQSHCMSTEFKVSQPVRACQPPIGPPGQPAESARRVSGSQPTRVSPPSQPAESAGPSQRPESPARVTSPSHQPESPARVSPSPTAIPTDHSNETITFKSYLCGTLQNRRTSYSKCLAERFAWSRLRGEWQD